MPPLHGPQDGPTRRLALRAILAAANASELFAQSRGPVPQARIPIAGSSVDVMLDSGQFAAGDAALIDWVRQSARSVAAYYGRFPVLKARIRIAVADRGKVSNGASFGDGGAHCRITVGKSASVQDLHDDWELTHEMVHFAFPSVPEKHHWIEEGIATYVEPIARASTGGVTVEQVWRDMVRDMHQGLPAAGDQGLDNTHTWGRTYWGGALFCLLADIDIRTRTANAKSLRDALRAINRAGGTIENDWPLSRALAIGDKATGVDTLSKLYARLALNPEQTELPALWERLGVRLERDSVSFDNTAPLAPIRLAMVQAP